MRRLDDASRGAVRAVIDANRAALEAIDGFIDVEPGFPVVNGAILREPAILVFVRHKKPVDSLPAQQRAMRQLGPYRVSVLQADPERQLRANAAFTDVADRMTAASI
jgi:hypothetical protein